MLEWFSQHLEEQSIYMQLKKNYVMSIFNKLAYIHKIQINNNRSSTKIVTKHKHYSPFDNYIIFI